MTGSNSCGKFGDYSPSFPASRDANVMPYPEPLRRSTHHLASLATQPRHFPPGGTRTRLRGKGRTWCPEAWVSVLGLPDLRFVRKLAHLGRLMVKCFTNANAQFKPASPSPQFLGSLQGHPGRALFRPASRRALSPKASTHQQPSGSPA